MCTRLKQKVFVSYDCFLSRSCAVNFNQKNRHLLYRSDAKLKLQTAFYALKRHFSPKKAKKKINPNFSIPFSENFFSTYASFFNPRYRSRKKYFIFCPILAKSLSQKKSSKWAQILRGRSVPSKDNF